MSTVPTSQTNPKSQDHNQPQLPLADIKEAYKKIAHLTRQTPTWLWKSSFFSNLLGKETELYLKLELFQPGGSFKPRGALMNMLALNDEQLEHGVTAVSAGNHAIATAYAAGILDTTAKVVMPRSASSARVDKCKSLGAEVVLVDNVHEAFDEVRRIGEDENRSFIHPFEGRLTALGTAGVGLELIQQVPDLEAVVVPIGGGGLCAGIAAAIKQTNPDCKIYGIEPEGADTMHRSFEAGEPQAIDEVTTIADSLGAPHAAPYSFALCRTYVDQLIKITDQQMRNAMKLLFDEMKLAVEPAGAATTAALFTDLGKKLSGKKVGLIVCGTNYDTKRFCKQVSKADLP